MVDCSVINLNKVFENNDAASKQGVPVKRLNESNTVNRINEAEERQPIEKMAHRNFLETSRSHCGKKARVKKMTQSPSVQPLIEKLLPENYVLDKTLIKITSLIIKFNKSYRVRRLSSP